MNKNKRLIINLIIFGIGNITVKLAQFFIMPMLTNVKFLSQVDYGITEILLNVLELALPIITLGMAESLFRFSIDKDKHSPEEIYSNGIAVVLVGSIVFSLGAGIVYIFLKNTYILLLIPLFIITGLKKVTAEFTRGQGKTLLYSIAGIVEAAGLIGAAATFIVGLRWGVNGYVLGLIAGALLSLIFYLIAAKPLKHLKFKSVKRSKLKIMLLFAIPTIPNMLSWFLVQMANRYVLVAFCGISIAALFMAAGKLPALVNVVSSVFLQAWSLSSAQESDKEKRDEFYSGVFKIYTVVVFFVVAGAILITPYISKFVLGDMYEEAWRYTPLLIFAAGLGCISAFYGAFFGAFYKTKYTLITTFIGAVVAVGTALLSVPFLPADYAVFGAVAGIVLGYAAIVISRIIATRKLVKIKTNWTVIIISLLLLFIQAVVYTIWAIPMPWIPSLILSIFTFRPWIFSIIIFSALFLAHFGTIRDIIKTVISKLKKKPAQSGQAIKGENMGQNNLKVYQDAAYEIMSKFADFCDEKGLKYYISYGTLLGAVRHGGFIPWDDDIDISMPREDFDKLTEQHITELPENLKLMYHKNTEYYCFPFAKIVNVNTTVVEKAGTGYFVMGAFIDVFPIDGAGSIFEDGVKRRRKMARPMLYAIASSISPERRKNKKYPWWQRLGAAFLHKIGYKKFQNKLDEKLRKVPYAKSEYVTVYSGDFKPSKIMPRSVYGEGAKIKFRDKEFNAPVDIDKFLTLQYGDYMTLPPLEDQKGHPFVYVALDEPFEKFNLDEFIKEQSLKTNDKDDGQNQNLVSEQPDNVEKA